MADKLDNLFRVRPPTFYLPGDPRSTNYVEACWRIATTAASLPAYQRPDRMYFSASDYGQIVAELKAQYDAPEDDPPYLIFGKHSPFMVLNAGTDDMAVVNRMNRDTPGAIDFAERAKQFDVVH